MKKYSTGYSHRRYSIDEFNWSYTKDANRLYAYNDIDEALEEMNELNKIIEAYEKYLE